MTLETETAAGDVGRDTILVTGTTVDAGRPGPTSSPNLDSPFDLDSLLDYYGDSVSSGGIQLSKNQSPLSN